jgi:hypothetical protein
VSTDGAVVDAKDVHGTITVEASNVTIKRTRVTSSDHYPCLASSRSSSPEP